MPDPRQARFRDSIRQILAVPDSASPERVRAVAVKLRHHIQNRLAHAPDEAFAEARRRELQHLDADLEEPRPSAEPSPSRRGWIGLLGFLLGAGTATLLAFLLAPPLQEEDPTPTLDTPARLSVDADPKDSAWTLYHAEDDFIVAEGLTDGLPRNVPDGSYRLRVDNPACPDVWERPVQLPSGESRRYAPTLCQGEGELIVEASEPGARLKIDGIDVGQTQGEGRSVRTGRHTVAVEKAGFEAWEGQISIASDERLRLHAELTPRPQEAGEAREARRQAAQASPPGATPAPTPPPPSPPASASSSESPPLRTRPGAGRGGSKSWHDAIRHQLVSDYDANDSGSLNTQQEIQSIPCPVLLSVESSYATGGLAVEMVHLYGFDGSDAPANTLGITPAMRSYAYDRMKSCGLRTRL